MNILALDIETATLRNDFYRKVITTTPTLQLVLMSISPEDREIGMEVHPHTTQFIRIEAGRGVAIIIPPDNYEQRIPLENGMAVIVPPGYYHNIVNLSENEDLKLYTIYAPPEHSPGKIEVRK